MDFNNVEIYVELGAGFGIQTEVIKKVNNNATILIFDIPPQLYMSERYLSAVFPGDVIPYRETREMNSLDNIEKGKIYIFPSWKMPLLESLTHYIFWSTWTFPEMEPENVRNYLSIVSQGAGSVYLTQIVGGARLKVRKGGPGVKKRVEWREYDNNLGDKFEQVSRTPYAFPARPSMYSRGEVDMRTAVTDEAFWRRKV